MTAQQGAGSGEQLGPVWAFNAQGQPRRGDAPSAPAKHPNAGSVTAGETASDFVPARPSFARVTVGLSADGIEGIEEGPRRSFWSRPNRFRRGVLGNLLARSGALRRL